MGKVVKTKKPKSTLSADKCPRVWEKARRDRLKVLFDELSRLLPHHDPSEPPSRPNIIHKAIEHVRDLQAQNEELLKGGFDDVYKNKLETWKKRVKGLLSRVEQLADILRTANIYVPPLALEAKPTWTTTRPKHWTHKINIPEDQMDEVIKNLSQQTKKTKVAKKRKVVECKENQPDNSSPKKARKSPQSQKQLTKLGSKKKLSNNVFSATLETQAKVAIPKTAPIILPQNNPITTIPPIQQLAPQNISNLIQTNPLSQPGTFILTNQGSLVPLLGPSVLTPLVINRPPSLLVMQAPPAPRVPQLCAPKPPPNKKRIERESTVMTFANKKPIPALSKQSHHRKGGKCVAHKNNNRNALLPTTTSLIPAVSPTANFLNSFPVVTTPRVLSRNDKPLTDPTVQVAEEKTDPAIENSLPPKKDASIHPSDTEVVLSWHISAEKSKVTLSNSDLVTTVISNAENITGAVQGMTVNCREAADEDTPVVQSAITCSLDAKETSSGQSGPVIEVSETPKSTIPMTNETVVTVTEPLPIPTPKNESKLCTKQTPLLHETCVEEASRNEVEGNVEVIPNTTTSSIVDGLKTKVSVEISSEDPKPIGTIPVTSIARVQYTITTTTATEIKIVATTAISWSSPLPIMSTSTSTHKPQDTKLSETQSNWPPPPTHNSWRSLSSETVWNGSGQTLTEPWGIPSHSNNYNQASNATSLQFSNASTFVNATTAFSVPTNTQSMALKGPWDNPTQDICPYIEGPYSTAKAVSVSHDVSNVAPSSSSPYGTYHVMTLANNSKDSLKSALKPPDVLPTTDSITKPSNSINTDVPPTEELKKSKSFYVPPLSEPWCFQTTMPAISLSKPQTAVKGGKVLISSKLDEPWKTPTFGQNTTNSWSLNSEPYYSNTTCAISTTFSNATFTYPAPMPSHPVIEPWSDGSTEPKVSQASLSSYNIFSAAATSKSSPIPKVAELSNKKGLSTRPTETWRPPPSYVTDMALSALPIAQGPPISWKDPLPISKIAVSTPYTASLLTSTNVSFSKTASTVSLPSRKTNAFDQTPISQIATSQSFISDAWAGRQLEPFSSVLPQYCQDDHRLNRSKHAAPVPFSLEPVNESPHLSAMVSTITTTLAYNPPFPTNYSDSKSTQAPRATNPKSHSETGKKLNPKFQSTLSVSHSPGTPSPCMSSISTKKGAVGSKEASEIKGYEMYPIGSSQPQDPTYFTNSSFVSSAPFTQTAPQIGVPAAAESSSASGVLSVADTKGNTRKEKKEIMTNSNPRAKAETAKSRQSATSELFGSASSKGEAKSLLPDGSGSLWNAQYFTQISGNEVLWSDYSCTVEPKDSRPKPPVNWMTESDQRNEQNYTTDDIFPPRYQNNSLLDILNNPLDQDSGKTKKKDVDFASQDYFGWMSMKVDSLVVPSTLPTLVGDLALGNESIPIKRKNQEYLTVAEKTCSTNYQAPYTNLSKNIFEGASSEVTKENNATETIVLKNIFELPAAPSKQRSNVGQNTFLSVSQLVETSHAENNAITPQNYYYNQRFGKSQQTDWKCADKKCQQQKPGSNYSTEALLRPEIMPPVQNFGLQSSGYAMDYVPDPMDNSPRIDKVTRQRKQEYYVGQELKSTAGKARPRRETSFLSPPSVNVNPNMAQYNTYSKILPNEPHLLPPANFVYPNTTIIGAPAPYSTRNIYAKNSSHTHYTDSNQKQIGSQTSTALNATLNYSKPLDTNANIPPAVRYSQHGPTMLHTAKNLNSATPVSFASKTPAHTPQRAPQKLSAKPPSCVPPHTSRLPPQQNPLLSTPLAMPRTYPPLAPLPPQSQGPSGSSLANFNLSTIFPEMNKKGYQYS